MRSVLDLVDRDGCIDVEMLRRCSRTRELTRERHRVTGSVRGSQQFLRTRLPVHLLDPGRQRERERVERTRRAAERAVAAGDIPFPGGVRLTLNSRHEDKAMRRYRICVAVTAPVIPPSGSDPGSWNVSLRDGPRSDRAAGLTPRPVANRHAQRPEVSAGVAPLTGGRTHACGEREALHTRAGQDQAPAVIQEECAGPEPAHVFREAAHLYPSKSAAFARGR